MLESMWKHQPPCIYYCWKCERVLQIKSMEIPYKIKNRTTIQSRIPTPGYLSKIIYIRISKRYLHSHVHCSVIYNSQDNPVFIKRQMDKENVLYTCNGILFSLEKEGNFPFAFLKLILFYSYVQYLHDSKIKVKIRYIQRQVSCYPQLL